MKSCGLATAMHGMQRLATCTCSPGAAPDCVTLPVQHGIPGHPHVVKPHLAIVNTIQAHLQDIGDSATAQH
jgi:hypothetical protein